LKRRLKELHGRKEEDEDHLSHENVLGNDLKGKGKRKDPFFLPLLGERKEKKRENGRPPLELLSYSLERKNRSMKREEEGTSSYSGEEIGEMNKPFPYFRERSWERQKREEDSTLWEKKWFFSAEKEADLKRPEGDPCILCSRGEKKEGVVILAQRIPLKACHKKETERGKKKKKTGESSC